MDEENKKQLKLLSDSWISASDRLKARGFYLRDLRGYNKRINKIGSNYNFSSISKKENSAIFMDFNIIFFLFAFYIRETVGSLSFCNYETHNLYFLSKMIYLDKNPPTKVLEKMNHDYIFPTPGNIKTYTITLRVGFKIRKILTYKVPLQISALLKGWIMFSRTLNNSRIFNNVSNDYMRKTIINHTGGIKLGELITFLDLLKENDPKNITNHEDRSVKIEDLRSSSENLEQEIDF